MDPIFGQFSTRKTSRRRAAAWLAILLNFALVPCTMALETSDPGHDCCPPSIELQPSECCAIDDICVDTRTKGGESEKLILLPATPVAEAAVVSSFTVNVGPPPPPDAAPPPIYLSNCVFLK